MANTTPVVPEDLSSLPDWMRAMAKSLNLMLKGRLNTRLTVTLTANSATTSVTDNRIGPETMVGLRPVTANAAAALTNIYQTIPNATVGIAVLNHTNNAQTDRTFRADLIG